MANSIAELVGWRTFNFYRLLPFPADSLSSSAAGGNASSGIELISSEFASDEDFVLFGGQKGAIFCMTKDLEIRFFKAFRQKLIHFAYSQGLLVAIGVDEEVIAAPSSSLSASNLPSQNTTTILLKVWSLNQWHGAVSPPPCKFSGQLNFGRKIDASLANFVAISEKLNVIVIGLSNSSLFYHLFLNDPRRNDCFIAPKWVKLGESTNPAKDGQLAGVVIGQVRNLTIVWCITDKTVHSYALNSEGNLLKTIMHDAKGCERKCWHYSKTTNQLIVASREMVYFYDINDDCLEMGGGENGRCHALGRGSDKVLQLLEKDGQIALVTEQETQIQSDNKRVNVLSVLDIESRYVSFFCPMPSPCHIFTLGGEICLLNSEGMFSKLVEESVENKLDILLKNNLFDLAINIARRGKSEEMLKSIFMKYGDYLYTKGDFDNSLKQYANAAQLETEQRIKTALKQIMQSVDLDDVTSQDIRRRLSEQISVDQRRYKEFIDHQMLVILGQLDRPSKILDYLYLGTEWNASNWEELKANGVQYILNVTKEVDNFFPTQFTYLKIWVSDEATTELLMHWQRTYDFIKEAKEKGAKVLVHCKKGISRSASTVIAYAMKAYGWGLDEALEYVKRKRDCITPNPGFMEQLGTFHGMLQASNNRHL
ncbi:hypothetical protein niasHT_004229 [Heterodera trifolii]|uniref:protein-serine/threonine phosphatase n=1 Tax=Heterodera trifolii TaxID=157864 RepID=A0ABD2ME35_9BILA